MSGGVRQHFHSVSDLPVGYGPGKVLPGDAPLGIPQMFVFSPGNPAPDNLVVFADWHLLYEALSAVPGARTVLFDPTFGGLFIPPHPTGQIYQMENVFFWGPFDGDPLASFTTVTFLDGCRFTSFPISSYLLDFRSLSTLPIVEFTGVKSVFLDNGVIIRSSSGVPFFRVLGGGTLLLVGQGVVILSSGVGRAIHLNAGATLFLGIWNSSSFQFNSISGDGGSTITGSIGGSVSYATQPLFFGFDNKQLADQSNQIRYINTTAPGTWAGVVPPTLGEATNRLATAVRGLLGIPIP